MLNSEFIHTLDSTVALASYVAELTDQLVKKNQRILLYAGDDISHSKGSTNDDKLINSELMNSVITAISDQFFIPYTSTCACDANAHERLLIYTSDTLDRKKLPSLDTLIILHGPLPSFGLSFTQLYYIVSQNNRETARQVAHTLRQELNLPVSFKKISQTLPQTPSLNPGYASR